MRAYNGGMSIESSVVMELQEQEFMNRYHEHNRRYGTPKPRSEIVLKHVFGLTPLEIGRAGADTVAHNCASDLRYKAKTGTLSQHSRATLTNRKSRAKRALSLISKH